MEENRSYRLLKNKRPSRLIQATSQSLLQPYPHKSVHGHRGIMSKNVSLYQHMIIDPHSKENYVDWAINLREHKLCVLKERQEENPPSAYFKGTILSNARKMAKDQCISSLNSAQFSQFFGKSSAYANSDSLDFINQLRSSTGMVNKGGQRFSSIPAKDRGGLPRLLKKNAIKKLRGIDKSDEEAGLDGDHNYPAYSYSGLREKNSALLNALSPAARTANLPNLAWEVGLRSY